ncbi:MAG: hypothetical protein ACLFM1_04870 [Bacteroidales bacterium]
MKQKIFTIVFVVFLSSTMLTAQTESYYTAPSDSTTNLSEPEITPETEQSSPFSKQKLSFHPQLNVGSSVYSMGGTPLFSSYFAPSLRIQPPGKFSFTLGSSVSYGNVFVAASPESFDNNQSHFEKMATYQMYASGSYQVNNKLSIRGGASMTLIPGQQTEPLKRGHFGFDYQIGEKTWISADFDFGDAMPYPYMNGMNPYNSGFNRSMPGFGHPGSSPFMY